jgi:Ubiquitin-activating enzyme E1 FCCH domain
MSKAQTVKFYGTTFQAVTSYSAGLTITGITNASPAVVTSVAHGLTSNDIVKISGVVGMTDLNAKNYAIEVLTVDTFELINADTTNSDTYTSGGLAAKGVLSGTCQMTGSTHGSGSTTEVTTETNCGITKDFGSPDDGQATFNYNYAPADFVTALESSRSNVTEAAIVTTLPSSAGIMIDIGVVVTVGRDGSAGGVWTGSATLTRTQPRVDLEV